MFLKNKSENWWLRFLIVIIVLSFMAVFSVTNRKTLELIGYQQKQIDSLNTEIFNLNSINGRYELTIDHLKEVNPSLGQEMEQWMDHETE